jgi:hypothetical protein
MASVTKAALPVLAALAAGCTDLRSLDHDRPIIPFDLGRWTAVGHTATLERADEEMVFRSSIPMGAEACRAALPDQEAICADVDRDDLADGWERMALDRWQPVVRLHGSEPMLGDLHGRAAAAGRVFLVDGPRRHVRLLIALLYERDYGRCSFTGHRGDVERVALDLQERADGSLVLAGAYTAAHEYTALDGSRLRTTAEELSELEFVEDAAGRLRWRVYASSGKHATYASRAACAGHAGAVCAREDCPGANGDGRDLLFNIGWAGEPPPFCTGPIWSDRPFCGLGYGWTGMDRSPCAPPVKEKLLRDPFAGHTENAGPPDPPPVPQACPDVRADSLVR